MVIREGLEAGKEKKRNHVIILQSQNIDEIMKT